MNTTSQMVAEMNLKPLTKKVLNYLRNRGPITPLMFWSTYGSMALPQQIHDLRDAGFAVKTTMKTDEEGTRYPSYSLEQET